MTEVTSRDHKASLISLTTEAEGAWKLAKKSQEVILFDLHIITLFESFC